jgi:trk system potassium uptake protein TrkA
MKIIIAGAGEVGFHLAKLLSFESQDITLIDTNREALNYADSHLDIRVIKGNATSLSILKDANVDQTDLLISVTSSETTNIACCVIAKQLGAKKTIARISNTEFIEDENKIGFSEIGIDELISPEYLAANEIELLLTQSAFSDTYEFEDGALTMIGLTLPRNSSFVDKSVREVGEQHKELKFVPIAIQRYGTQYTIIPRGDTLFKEGDRVYFITLPEGVDEIIKLTGKTHDEIKSVMILGGSKIGIKTASKLCENHFQVKLFEKNKEKAFDLVDELPSCLIIQGDGRNVDILEEEAIDDMDAFIAVTGNSETNIMSCLVAKSKGVRKTIALVENMDYFQLSQSIGIDTLINKKLLAANNIFRYIRKGEIVAMTILNNMNAELLEFIVTDSSKVKNKKIKTIDFPRSAIIGGVVRDGKGMIALGDFEIKVGDRIVICSLPQSIKKVESLFV